MRTPRLIKAVVAKIRQNPACCGNKMAREKNLSRDNEVSCVGRLGREAVQAQKNSFSLTSSRSKGGPRAQMLPKWYPEKPDVVMTFPEEKLLETRKKFNHHDGYILSPEASCIPDKLRNIF